MSYIINDNGVERAATLEETTLIESDKIQSEQTKQKTSYIINRQLEYPSIYEYVDGIVKNDQTQINNYIEACLKVKAKYPKPK